jgi:membrane-associated phospholipid phosphatase
MQLDQIFDYIGFYGPNILFILSLVVLRNKMNLMLVYVVGFIANTLLNHILKGAFQQPRPTEEIHLFQMEQLYRKQIGFDRYGMPSGHAQSVLYSTAFIYYAFKNIKVTTLYLIVSLMTLYQRVKFKNHTVFQVIIGSLVGFLVGFSFYSQGEKYLKGILKGKPDDNVGH